MRNQEQIEADISENFKVALEMWIVLSQPMFPDGRRLSTRRQRSEMSRRKSMGKHQVKTQNRQFMNAAANGRRNKTSRSERSWRGENKKNKKNVFKAPASERAYAV